MLTKEKAPKVSVSHFQNFKMSTHKANISKEDIVVEGSVDLGYEKVQAAFEDLFRKAQRLKLIEDTCQWFFFPNQKSRKLIKLPTRTMNAKKYV